MARLTMSMAVAGVVTVGVLGAGVAAGQAGEGVSGSAGAGGGGGPSREEPAAALDKSGYHLLNPTPRALRRPISADRPDVTESPITVDAGAVQIEASFFEFSRDRADGGRVDQWLVAPTLLKVGVLNDLDVQLYFEPWMNENPRGAEGGPSVDGVGDLTLRLKYNVWGNDEGRTALGILPYITFPTARDELATRGGTGNRVSGGFAVPFGVELAEGWDLGVMGQLDFFRDEGEGEDVTEFLHSIALGFPLVETLRGFVEYVGVEPLHGGGSYRALLGGGLVWEMTPDVHWDVAVRAGLTRRDTEEFAILAGVTVRF